MSLDVATTAQLAPVEGRVGPKGASASSALAGGAGVRTDWTRAEIAALFDLPFHDLILRAAETHRAHHTPGEVQLCTLLSIKTGGCPEDCGYCSQSAHHGTGLKAEKLMAVDEVLAAAAEAKAAGSQRFCMGAAWRNPKDRDLPKVVAMVEGVKRHGAGDLHDAGHAGAASGPRARRCRPRLLQPQHRHRARTLWRRHHDAHLWRPARHAGPCARRRDRGVLRRDRGDGGGARGSGRLRPRARHPATPSGERAGERAWCRCAARRWATCWPTRRWPRSTTSSSSARWRSPASPCRAPWSGSRPGRESMSEATQALCFLAGANSDLHRRQAADDGQRRRRRGRGPVRQAGTGADDGRGADAGGSRMKFSERPAVTPLAKLGCIGYALIGTTVVGALMLVSALGDPAPRIDVSPGQSALQSFIIFPGSLIAFLSGGVLLAWFVTRERE